MPETIDPPQAFRGTETSKLLINSCHFLRNHLGNLQSVDKKVEFVLTLFTGGTGDGSGLMPKWQPAPGACDPRLAGLGRRGVLAGVGRRRRVCKTYFDWPLASPQATLIHHSHG